MQIIKLQRPIFLLLALLSCGYPEEYSFRRPVEGERYTGIEIIPRSAEVAVGGGVKAEAVMIHSSGVKSPAKSLDVSWASENDAIACVDGDGLITGIGEGGTRITASLGGFAAECLVRVGRPADYSLVVISEVFYDAVGSDTGKEFIEIHNGSDVPCDISGFYLIDGSPSSSAFVFPAGTVIAAGGRLVVAQSEEEFIGLFGVVPDFAGFSFTLNNSGETVFLEYPDGAIRDAVYIEGGSADFPAPADWGSSLAPASREGFSVMRMVIADSDLSSDWAEGMPGPGG